MKVGGCIVKTSQVGSHAPWSGRPRDPAEAEDEQEGEKRSSVVHFAAGKWEKLLCFLVK